MSNSLADMRPELVREWSEKNEIKPTEVSVGSHKKVLWKCKHGHEWEASVKSYFFDSFIYLILHKKLIPFILRYKGQLHTACTN